MKLTRTLSFMMVALLLFGCCDKDCENPDGGNNSDDDAGSEKNCDCSDDSDNPADAGIDTAENDSDPECSIDEELREQLLVKDEKRPEAAFRTASGLGDTAARHLATLHGVSHSSATALAG